MTTTEQHTFGPGRSALPVPPWQMRAARAFPALVKLPLFRRALMGTMPSVRACNLAPGFFAVCPERLFAQEANLNDTVLINYAPVHIGRGVDFYGENMLLTSWHDPQDRATVHAKPIVIEDGASITYRCIVLAGVTIGKGAIVGAGSVVTRDIPAGVLAAGNPCKVIRALP